MKKPTTNRSRNLAMHKTAFCDHPMKRPNYYAGQLLTADDFRAEQDYHREKQRRHNLLCHGFGAVQGLRVSTVKESAGSIVVIEPGSAIDLAGNEIQLCATLKLQLPESPDVIQVGIRFSERLCEPVPVVSELTMPSSQPSRVEEGFEVLLGPTSVRRAYRAKRQGPGRSQDALPLARLVRKRRAWRVDRKFKSPRAH
jgi:hypothetical protein